MSRVTNCPLQRYTCPCTLHILPTIQRPKTQSVLWMRRRCSADIQLYNQFTEFVRPTKPQGSWLLKTDEHWWRFLTLLWSRSEPYPARPPTLWLSQPWRKTVWSLQREQLHIPMTWSAINVTEDCLLISSCLTVAYVPLTVFLVIVVVFHASVTSPQLNAAVFVCRAYSIPTNLRTLTQTSNAK